MPRKVPLAGAGAMALNIRLRHQDRNTLGPGKVALLEAIEANGSISGAGRALGMSYRRAWLLVEALNGQFAQPLVHASHGGREGGGAVLTEAGTRVVALYREIEAKAMKASAPEREALSRMALERNDGST